MNRALHLSHFDRQVVAVLGLPFDVVGMREAVAALRDAAFGKQRCFISTPNLNFLMTAQDNPAFRESVVQSDLSLADGMPLVWLARVLRLPIKERVSGASLFEELCLASPSLGVFFFGGPPNIARSADQRINQQAYPGIVSRGYFDPGYGSVADMSRPEILDVINRSQADFVIVALGAQKGQTWIQSNRHILTAPLICHLGAVINFAAGRVLRAPGAWQRWGLEWLWRMKEEPALWRRYGRDGLQFLRLVLTLVLPHAVLIRWPSAATHVPCALVTEGSGGVLRLQGAWGQNQLQPLRQALKAAYGAQCAALTCKPLTIDLQAVTHVDSHFIGLIMLARCAFASALKVQGAGPRVGKIFKYHLAGYLLSPGR